MTADSPATDRPDLSGGLASAAVAEGAMVVGRLGEDEVLIARADGKVFAIGATCSHYHGPLGEGLLVGDTVRCPWHHARFCLRTGEALAGPAIDPVRCWSARERDGKIFLESAPQPTPSATPRAKSAKGPRRVLIAGGGAAGFATTEMLRRRGFDGAVTLISADADAPYDRPNCSKDYLAGEAPVEWMPLRERTWYADNGVELKLNANIGGLDLAGRTATLNDGTVLSYDALVLALGAEPQRPPIAGFDQPSVHMLRSVRDADAIIGAAGRARRVAIVGASFIGLEVAAALRHRGLEVHVSAPEEVPLARVLGEALGQWIRRLHEANGVVFHLGRKVLGYEAGKLGLDNGEAIAADFVVAGTGVRPRTALAEAAGLQVENGVVVDRYLRTSVADVFAAGDVARYPDRHSAAAIRVEHWVHAERQGQHVARMILGEDAPFSDTPFFWSAHYGKQVNYVGHAQASDPPVVEGSIADESAVVRFGQDGKVLAVASVGRDLESLEAGLRMETEAA